QVDRGQTAGLRATELFVRGRVEGAQLLEPRRVAAGLLDRLGEGQAHGLVRGRERDPGAPHPEQDGEGAGHRWTSVGASDGPAPIRAMKTSSSDAVMGRAASTLTPSARSASARPRATLSAREASSLSSVTWSRSPKAWTSLTPARFWSSSTARRLGCAIISTTTPRASARSASGVL